MHFVLLAGGKGTRLWPMSRKGIPKHLLSFFSDKSLFQKTMLRVRPLLGEGKIVIVTAEDQIKRLRHQVEEIGIDLDKVIFLSEVVGRNTAPAVCWAAGTLKRMGCSGAVVMLPCDHYIKGDEVFLSQIKSAANFCEEKEELVLFGVEPSFPSTGYGYIGVSVETSISQDGYQLFEVTEFREKPNRETAQAYVDAGRYYWNSGMLVFDLDKFYQLCYETMSDIVGRVEKILDGEDASKIYPSIRNISLDYAMLEQVESLWCMPTQFFWSDVGSWDAIYSLEEKDSQENVCFAEAVVLDSKRNLIASPKGKVVGVIGITNLIVVDTEDALLICRMDESQKVKDIVAMLQERDDVSWRDPARVERNWGYYVVLDRGPRYKTKRIVVYPGKALSLQRHQHRSEHWVVLSGVAKVRCGEREFLVHPNESTYIPVGEIHKLENPGKIPLEIIEVQNGEYLEEDDIERFD